MSDDARGARAAGTSARPAVAAWALLAGLAALALGTLLAIAGVNAPGLFLPGVYVLDLALLLLAAAGILRAAERAPSA